MSLDDTEIQEIIDSIPIVPAKLKVNRRVVYRASAGCADRLGIVIGVYKTFINEKYAFTYSVKLDPIIVNSNSIQIRSDAMCHGKNIEPGSRVVFTEQEVWNDNVSDVFLKCSNAIVMEGRNVCDRDGCRQTMTYTIQLDNVRAQNEMIRNEEPSDIVNCLTLGPHISKKSTVFWDEDADQIFEDFSKYVDRVRLAIKEYKTVMDLPLHFQKNLQSFGTRM